MRQAFEGSLNAGLDYERKAFTVLAATDDRNEGLAAFLEKRKPRFTGRYNNPSIAAWQPASPGSGRVTGRVISARRPRIKRHNGARRPIPELIH